MQIKSNTLSICTSFCFRLKKLSEPLASNVSETASIRAVTSSVEPVVAVIATVFTLAILLELIASHARWVTCTQTDQAERLSDL